MNTARNIILLMVLAFGILACSQNENSADSQSINPEVVPTMMSTNVTTIISDSGQTRYRIKAPEWLMFEEAKQPHWVFPKGIIAEELDDKDFSTISSISCDSAYYDEPAQLWTLTGNVKVTNSDGDLILTNQMIWEQNNHVLYSDSFIHIYLDKKQEIIEGTGYRTNETFSTYEIKKVSAIFPVDESRFPN
ncbi:MAG: LPS export ABC transporter periplasmic protein LptC [Muribaculaceae bacterium]|nr:LPS export ABC transporter periplasmic protein LptC [Muribaculaceae bacterium]